MKKHLRLGEAMNTYNSALSVIKSKGYKIFLYPDESEDKLGEFWAIKEGREIIASDPLTLLGLISMTEALGEKWQTSKYESRLYDSILEKALPNSVDDFEKLSEQEFEIMVKDYQVFFNALGREGILANISRKDFFKLIDNFYRKAF